MTKDRGQPAPGQGLDERKARQAAALRDNLRRRKAQLHARREQEEETVETPLAPTRPAG